MTCTDARYVYRGDSLSLDFFLTAQDSPQPLTGYVVTALWIDPSGTDLGFAVTTPGDVTLGQVNLSLSSAQTSALEIGTHTIKIVITGPNVATFPDANLPPVQVQVFDR